MSITQTIVTNVMDALRANNVPFVVAPFEADAQVNDEVAGDGSRSLVLTAAAGMAPASLICGTLLQMVWMCKTGAVSAIVTEDSDVFLYCIASGVDAPVLFKLDDSGFVQVSRA